MNNYNKLKQKDNTFLNEELRRSSRLYEQPFPNFLP